MNTKFTKPIKINAPGEDLVFDGIDFTEDATIEIIAVNSITFKNCRFYNIALNSKKDIIMIGSKHMPKAAGYKLVIENCYFGNNGTYNMINAGQKLFDGSCFNSNYCTNDCTRDDRFACYFAVDGSTYNFNGNMFENYSHNGIQFSFYESPTVTINVNDNEIGVPADDIENDTRGLVRFRPTPSKTKSFANITLNANNNKFAGEEDRVAFCQYKSAKDLVLTEENVPKYYLNGELTPIEILNSVPVEA